ncbi:type IV pilus biogenesis/stability protein PilW [Colwellia echini]|uniref:Type IV pilus biogenesis/stability protein PilW n=1 Tax=Colwellia echini TaxID=1982103 RepID=A0ABY3N1L5_9GAMM|nr:type IV pilus biogenesis/stability protein PilW [Colwellia echini]TYK67380.1 type IV pilus biogenesis/stability protein PilW [Colwellia echini]
MNKAIAKYFTPTLLSLVSISVLSGCVTQSFENNEPIIKSQANRDEMAATRISLGLGYLKMGDMPQAKLNLEKAKQFSPKLVQVYTAFAHYYETVGEATLAKESFEQALVLDADSADTLNNYGVFLCRQGQIAEAEVQFLKAIAVPTYLMVSQSYENLSSCYLQNDNFVKAELYLNKAIYHDPNRTALLLQMVRLQYAMGNYTEAKGYLLRFERNTQRFTPDSLSLAYKLYWKLGQRRTANNYASMLVKMYPESWEAKQYLLNELAVISADELAKKYQLTNKHKDTSLSSVSDKRVVKLSPAKSDDTPYTTSVRTSTRKVNTQPATALAQTATATNAVVSTAAQTTKQASMGTGAAVISATAAGAAISTTANPDAENEIPVAPEQQIVKEEPVDMFTKSETVGVSEIVEVSEETNTGSNSTQPVPATRDVALPDAIPAKIIAEPAGTDTLTAEDLAVLKAEQEMAAQAALDKAIFENQINVSSDKVTTETETAKHTVESGENLYNISVKYNVKLDTLLKWNNISQSNKIRTGDKLYVVDPTTVNTINE